MVNNTITIQHTITETYKGVYEADTTKTDSSYAVVPLPDMIKTELKKRKEKQLQYRLLQPNDFIDSGYVCSMTDGSRIKPNYVTQHFKILLHKHNLPVIRFHDLRHSSANYLKYLKFDLKDIQVWLRHSDIQTTMNIYVNLDMEARTEIANKLNEKFSQFAI